MARLFSDLLSQPPNTSMSSQTEPSDLRQVYKEIKLLRKYQLDLNNKFNLLVDKLDSQMSGSGPAAKSPVAAAAAPASPNKHQKQEAKAEVNLTGAKKRKFNSAKNYAQCAQDPPRSASVSSSSSSDTSSSSHTSTTTDMHLHQPHQFAYAAGPDDSNPELTEMEDGYADADDMPDYELDQLDEPKSFKYPAAFAHRLPNFKYPGTTHQFQNVSQSLGHTPPKTALNPGLNQTYDLDLNELFKGNGPKYLQLESYANFKAPIVVQHDKHFVDESMAALSYSKSKSRRNFAAHLTKLVFTPRERLESNCNGRFGKKALDSVRLLAIRNTIFKYYPCKQSTVILNGDKITSGDHDENSVWVRDCIPAIDESNRVLKKQLVAWYKKNNPSILIRHNGGPQHHAGQHSLSPGTSGALNCSAGFVHASTIDECHEAFDDVDEC